MGVILEARDVVYQYHTGPNSCVTALDRINLTVEAGEFVAIIGRNGSGKSTLARHFNALILPTAGEVRVKGLDTRDTENLWKIRQTVGMVFQNPDNQLVSTVVEEDVAFGPENLAVSPGEIARRVDFALHAVGMEQYRYHALHHLSGGQKQRIAIAGVLAMQPECIVLDEPTAMLDPQGRYEVMRTIRELNRHQGVTVVLITHFMREAVDADRVVVMDRGKVALQGTPREVFRQAGKLSELGLELPQVTEFALGLQQAGLAIGADILSIDEMVERLCQLKYKI